MIVYWNGRWVEETEACVSIHDRGFVFADAVYEVIHVYHGRCFALDAHLARLQNSLSAIKIRFDAASLRPVLDELLHRAGVGEEGMVYIQITRGVEPRAHGLPQHLTPTVLAYAKPVVASERKPWENGIQAVFFEDIRWKMCHIKTTGLLVNCIAREYALEQGAQEAIFCRGDVVTEATASNLFMVKGGELFTHPNGPYILPGITRDVTIRLAQEMGFPVHESPFTKEQLMAADEIFLTGTLSEITPVVAVEGNRIGGGKPGPVTQSLRDAFMAYVNPEKS
jgi:D-alanine transaminase